MAYTLFCGSECVASCWYNITIPTCIVTMPGVLREKVCPVQEQGGRGERSGGDSGRRGGGGEGDRAGAHERGTRQTTRQVSGVYRD